MPGRRKRGQQPPILDRKRALQAVPVLNQLVTIERDARGHVVLNLPRRRTATVRLICKVFRLSPYKRIELDELGSCVVELCNGRNAVSDIVTEFARRFRLSRRETEVSMLTYLSTLARRGIIGLAVPKDSTR